jgi:hypothetical protein
MSKNNTGFVPVLETRAEDMYSLKKKSGEHVGCFKNILFFLFKQNQIFSVHNNSCVHKSLSLPNKTRAEDMYSLKKKERRTCRLF